MQNNINDVSFQANLKPLTKIKNKEAFTEARNIFKEATKNYPNDSIYITKNTFGETIINLSDETGNSIYSQKNIGTKNIDKQIEEMGADKFAEKLINMFNALKLQEEASLKIADIKSKLVRLTKIMQININAAHNWKLEGKDGIAKRYDVKEKNNKGKINQLKSEQQMFKDEYNKKIEDLSKQYKEIIQLKIR